MAAPFRAITLATAATLLLPIATLAPASAKKAAGSTVLKTVDTDNDGTIDLKEVEAAASSAFDRLDPDSDGTLDVKELKGRLSPKALKQADPDGDGTLDKKEFVALAGALFKEADPDGDGTVDAKELGSPAGKALARLLK